MPTDLPPILILMCDQQRADAMSCAGTGPLRTPNMDRIAAEGVRFANACTVSPLCMPARASFVSGVYPHNHAMWTNRGELPADDETFFHHLQAAGYHVAYVGKSHFYEHGGMQHMRDREPYMHARGIDTVYETTGPWATCNTKSWMTDDWEKKGLWKVFRDDYAKRREAGSWDATWASPLPEDEHLDSKVGRKAVDVIDAYSGDRPLCLFVGFGGPHEPWDAPGRYADMYDPADCDPAIAPEASTPADLPDSALRHLVRGRRDDVDEAQVRKIRALYYGKVSLLDRWFGEILDAYGRRGWLDDALMVHWSDHGEMLGDHGRLHKRAFFDSSLRIAMTLRWRGRFDGGQVSESLVETVDVFPTLLEAVGAEPSERCLGRSMWPCLRDPSVAIHDAVFSEVEDTTMVCTPTHKYAVDADGIGYMLFDLETDPTESRNLIGTPGTEAVEGELRERLLRFLLSTQTRR